MKPAEEVAAEVLAQATVICADAWSHCEGCRRWPDDLAGPIAAAITAARREGEQAGAERMRERAIAAVLARHPALTGFQHRPTSGQMNAADAIRALPLEEP